MMRSVFICLLVCVSVSEFCGVLLSVAEFG